MVADEDAERRRAGGLRISTIHMLFFRCLLFVTLECCSEALMYGFRCCTKTSFVIYDDLVSCSDVLHYIPVVYVLLYFICAL